MIWIARAIAEGERICWSGCPGRIFRDRLSSAIEHVEDACGNDIERFCSEVTPGGGRIASCMQAYSDQLSRRCQFTLRRFRVQQAVENIADTCMTAVQQQCGDTDNVRNCVQQKRSSLPQSCQTIVAAVQTGQALAARAQGQERQAQAQAGQQAQGLRGMPVFSSDGKNLGQVAQVERGPDGKIQSVQIQMDGCSASAKRPSPSMAASSSSCKTGLG